MTDEYRSKMVIHDESIDLEHSGTTKLTIKYEHISLKRRLQLMFRGYGWRALLMSGSTVTHEHPNYPKDTRYLYPGDEYCLRHTVQLFAERLQKNRWEMEAGNMPLVIVYKGQKCHVTEDKDGLHMEPKFMSFKLRRK